MRSSAPDGGARYYKQQKTQKRKLMKAHYW